MPFPSSLAGAARHGQTVDFVSSDLAALASHMEHCAQARGSMFTLKRRFQMGRAALSGRLVTVAFVSRTVVALAIRFV